MRADDSINKALGDLQSGDDTVSVEKTREWIINKVLPAGEEMYQALKFIVDATLFSDEMTTGTWQGFRRKAITAIAKYEALRGNNG